MVKMSDKRSCDWLSFPIRPQAGEESGEGPLFEAILRLHYGKP